MPSTSGPASASLLRRVTHICLHIVAYTWPYHLEQFSRLSHLAVPYVSGGNPSHPIGGLQPFLKLQSLEMLVVVVIKADLVDAALEEWENWAKEMRKMDSRVYFAEHDAKYTSRDEWEKEMRGGMSIWDRAILLRQNRMLPIPICDRDICIREHFSLKSDPYYGY